MELPAPIRQALDATATTATLEDATAPGHATPLRMVLLRDDEGQLQAICRRQDLLDLARLNKILGRDLRLVPRRDQQRVRERLGLGELPPLPSLTGWPTVVDNAVSAAQTVSLELSGEDFRLVIDREAFDSLASDAGHEDFCVPADSVGVNHDRPEHDRDQLHSAIQRFTGLRIRQRLDDTLELPPLPETAQRIIHLRVNPNATMGDLVDIVESDPSLAAQVVSWASSSFYAAAGSVRSVHDAVSRVLGFELVMNLAMGLALGRTLKQPADQPEGYMGYWQQAIWQAQSAGILATMMPRGQRPAFGLAYLAGLLHNFGYLVLAQVFPPHFHLACRNWEANPDLDTMVVEHHLLGVSREQIGAELMDNWGMPGEVVTAMRQQKNPRYRGENDTYARILWLGRQLLSERGIALGVGLSVPDTVYQELGLNRARVAEQFDDLVQSRDAILAMAGMMSSS